MIKSLLITKVRNYPQRCRYVKNVGIFSGGIFCAMDIEVVYLYVFNSNK